MTPTAPLRTRLCAATRLAAALLASLAPACASIGAAPAPQWVSDEYDVASHRILWEYVLLTLEKTGYPLGGGIDPHALVVVTGWQTHLSPFKDEGFRQRAEMRIEPVGPGSYRVEARVQRQTNAALAKPTDPRYADWRWQPDDTAAAGVLLHHVGSYLQPEFELERP